VACDWKAAYAAGTGSPEATIVSLYRYIESEIKRLGIIDVTAVNSSVHSTATGNTKFVLEETEEEIW